VPESDRPLRFCDVCGGLDDHPRHVIAVPPGTAGAEPAPEFLAGLPNAPVTAVALLIQPTTLIRHIDCCAAQGCEVCAATEAATKGKRGEALVKVIADGALDDVDVDGLNVGGI
jgi:hypothetical protein